MVKNAAWSDHPVDRFILAKLEERGLEPASPSDKRTLIRRLAFALSGLPPTPEETRAFLQDTAATAYERLVDRLLASPRFGERWARHWMDLMRFAETHGSEGDPEVPQAWRYRDYLIRAFNADVPYDQLIREHLAGDLLRQPRWNQEEGFNESILGTAHLRLVEHGFQPVDTLDDQMKVIENQIDVLGKAFQGLTIACARCHDHKFDPISQRDFYALYGIFASCRPALVTVDAPERLRAHRLELGRLKHEIKAGLVQAWTHAAAELAARLLRTLPASTGGPVPTPEDEMKERITALERRLVQAEEAAVRNLLRAGATPASHREVPLPMAMWTFEGSATDLLGEMHGELRGGASLKHGRLVLNGQGAFVRTAPLRRELREKTLEVWLTLASREQRGGGALSVQTQEGGVFDAIVFGEKEPGKWTAGSDGFRRTQVVNGPAETASATQLVHLAIVFRADSSIAIYRNGTPYGSPYTPAGEQATLRTFPARSSHLLLGLRHTSVGNGFLAGEIDEARLYDRALSGEQVKASFAAGTTSFTPDELAKSITQDERAEQVRLRDELELLRAEFKTRFPHYPAKEKAHERLAAALAQAANDNNHPLHLWANLREKSGDEFVQAWQSLAKYWQDELPLRRRYNSEKFRPGWDLTAGDDARWFKYGVNPTETVARAGEFAIEPEGERIVTGLYPAGVYSHLLSQKHNGVLTSPRFKVESDNISIRALGGKGARVRLIVDNYPLGSGGIFPQAGLTNDAPSWIRLDTAYRKDSWAYLEFAPAEEVVSRDRPAPGSGGRSYFGAQRVVFHDGKEAPKEETIAARELLRGDPPGSAEELAERVSRRLVEAVTAWATGQLSEDQRAWLDPFIRSGLLPNTTNELERLAPLVADYRQLESELPAPRRAPGVFETAAYDAPLLARGDHTKPNEPVPRRYLEVVRSSPYQTRLSGRQELALDLASPDNPLTARVMVNRVWQHLFGRGLVATVDNFGRLGDKPTHPELLDFLAARFVDQGWSIKQLIRFLITSETFRLASDAPASAQELDPANELLSHMGVRRLEAEAIRDSLLAVSGRLDATMFGPGVDALAAPADQKRRSLYLTIRRNSLSPFLDVFDAPKPFTTLGRRDTTNVPAQSLALLNDPFVTEVALHWAHALLARGGSARTRVREMFEGALGRPPTKTEVDSSLAYLADLAREHNAAEGGLSNENVWRDYAQALFNFKEFIYIR